MNAWNYNNNVFTSEDIGDYFGFIYQIEFLNTGQKYIGRKSFYTLRKDPKNKTKRRVKKESNWKDYYSSSEVLKNLVKEFGKDLFNREILLLCKSSGELNYSETKYLFKNDVLESDDWFNSNIIGRYYSENVIRYYHSNIS
jgi:hypothetical protein